MGWYEGSIASCIGGLVAGNRLGSREDEAGVLAILEVAVLTLYVPIITQTH